MIHDFFPSLNRLRKIFLISPFCAKAEDFGARFSAVPKSGRKALKSLQSVHAREKVRLDGGTEKQYDITCYIL